MNKNDEALDNYPLVRCKLARNWRIASCYEGRQYILQNRDKKQDYRWVNKKYYSKPSHMLAAIQNISESALVGYFAWLRTLNHIENI